MTTSGEALETMSQNELGLAAIGDSAIEQITANRLPHYEPYGWHHWPDHPWLSYQFRRGLGETQEGGGAVSEVFQAASSRNRLQRSCWQPGTPR